MIKYVIWIFKTTIFRLYIFRHLGKHFALKNQNGKWFRYIFFSFRFSKYRKHLRFFFKLIFNYQKVPQFCFEIFFRRCYSRWRPLRYWAGERQNLSETLLQLAPPLDYRAGPLSYVPHSYLKEKKNIFLNTKSMLISLFYIGSFGVVMKLSIKKCRYYAQFW